MNGPEIRPEMLKPLLETKFLRAYDLRYEEGRHYYMATRRPLEETAAVMPEKQFREMLPDAVSCFVILRSRELGDRLLMNYEYRYPAGRFLLSPPAGLIDPEDKTAPDPLIRTARREILEETGIVVKETDRCFVVSPLAFSSPGMTDESNALVCAVVTEPDLSHLSQSGAVGTEKFDGFVLADKKEAARLLKQGRDDHGHYYSMFTWAALTYFVSGLWEEE